MKNGVGRALMALLGVTAIGVPALVRAKEEAKAKVPPGAAVFTPRADIKFKDVPEFKGLQMAALEGDPAKGPSHIMLKFDPGFSAPLHHHKADHYVTVVAGTMVLTVDGQEHKLAPGSFFSFSQKAPHTTRCEAGAECILSLDVRGKWDVVPEKTMAAK
jgi:quercetin dioxygenase-like cupin family protein